MINTEVIIINTKVIMINGKIKRSIIINIFAIKLIIITMALKFK